MPTSHDADKITIPIEVVADEKSKQVLNQLKGNSEKLGQTFKKTTDEGGKGFKQLGYQITFIAWHIRFLGNILEGFSKQFTRIVMDWITVGAELQDRFFGLQTSAAVYGFEADKAIQVSRDLAQKGLVPLTSSAAAMSNIMLTGAFNVDQASDFMERYLDVATLVTGGQDEMSKSLEFFSESVLRGTMVLGTDVTARAIWNITNQRANKELGISIQKLTAQQRIIEVQRTLYENFNDILGLHEVRMALVGANITKATESYQYLKLQLTEALWPAIKLVSEGFVRFANIIGELVKRIGPIFPAFVLANVVSLMFLGTLLTLTGVILSMIKIMNWANVMIGQKIVALEAVAISTKRATTANVIYSTSLKILGFSIRWAIPLLFVLDAILVAVTMGILKSTGATSAYSDATDKMGSTIKKLSDELSEQSDLFGQNAEEGEDAYQKQALAHQRRVDDLEEDLQRERSKGLWADQASIRDLEKRLSRENEDWDAYLKEREQQTGTEVQLFDKYFTALDDLSDEAEKQRTVWSGLWDGIITGWEKAKNAFIKIWEEIKEHGYYDIGKRIGEYISDGIIYSLNWFTELNKKIEKWLNERDFFDIGEQMGKWISRSIGETLYWATIGFPIEITKALIKNDWRTLGQKLADWVSDSFIWQMLFAFTFGLPFILLSAFKGANYSELGKALGETIVSAMAAFFSSAKAILLFVGGLASGITYAMRSVLSDVFSGFSFSLPNFRDYLPFQTGHLQVPGNYGQPRLAVLHGRERITPAHENNMSESTVINFYNPIVRSDSDLTALAQMVEERMSLKNKWASRGAY